MTEEFNGLPVVITTQNRGVFFGYLQKFNGNDAILANVRNCIYWRGVKGFIGLAYTGPNKDCRIGPKAKKALIKNITAILEASKKATAAWESEPWKE